MYVYMYICMCMYVCIYVCLYRSSDTNHEIWEIVRVPSAIYSVLNSTYTNSNSEHISFSIMGLAVDVVHSYTVYLLSAFTSSSFLRVSTLIHSNGEEQWSVGFTFSLSSSYGIQGIRSGPLGIRIFVYGSEVCMYAQ